MDYSSIYTVIRNTVQAYLPKAKVLLFGSHARGEADSLSDYDLLVITPETLDDTSKILWSTRLNKAIVEAIHAPVDILINSEEEIQKKRELPGHIIRSVMREGFLL